MESIPKYLSPVSLIPGGCPQFLDFELPAESILRLKRYFREEKQSESSNEEQRYSHYLRCLEQKDDDFFDMLTGQPAPYDYTMDARKELETWENQWLPLPFLRIRDQKWPDGGDRFEYGPSNWARCRLVRPKDKPDMLRLVLVFDTNIENPPVEGEHYHALTPKDVAAHGMFKLAGHVRDNAWFLNAAWVDEWLLGLYGTFRQARHRGRESWQASSPYVLEHLASYLTWLAIVEQALGAMAVQVINPDRDTPVDVDLVLDIGNSRTTGILVETLPQRITNLNDSYLLQLRDMTYPEHIYTEPFDTRVEFAEVSFGNDALSRRSGRISPAFAWPSAVRIGPEAARIATHAICAEGVTGMSSPKRYLWDERPWQQSWRFNTGGQAEPMVTRGPFAKQLNQEGTPLECFTDPLFKKCPALRNQECEPAFESLFTRSSLMMFMMGEILTQALVTINSPATRARRELPNLPRRLRRVIFTVPTAMPVAEKRIFNRWVTWAVQVVWQALGWSEHYCQGAQRLKAAADYRLCPEIRCDWDEASCSQLVMLYNELTVKHHGDAYHLFNLMGKRRAEYDNHPCVRVASIDIGGGTTDLSITTFELSSGEQDTARLTPHMEFRDGFNIAGDEVLREIIVDHIKPAMQQALSTLGMPEPRILLSQLFGRDSIGISQEARNLRTRFIRQLAVPVALGLLGTCESTEQNSARAENAVFTCRIGDFFEAPLDFIAAMQEPVPSPLPEHIKPAPRPQASVLRGIRDIVSRAAPHLAEFDVMQVELRVIPAAVNKTIQQTLGNSLAALCELAHLYDADQLLLTGRPSSWQGVINAVLAKLPLPPDRVIPMRQYHVGAWYPFADTLGRIVDPKTTVVVGAILCALSEGHIEGFTFDSAAFRLSSTARYVGEMDISSQLRQPKVWFTVDVASSKEQELERQVSFGGPLPIGYRQLDVERWPTTRYHLLTFRTEEARSRAAGRLPYSVSVRLTVTEIWDEGSDRDEGEFAIDAVTDRHGNNVDTRDLEIRLQTLPLDEGYWLDTGNVADA
jgi:hypothetical protein